MPNGPAVSLEAGRQPVRAVPATGGRPPGTPAPYYLLYDPKSYSSSGTASPEPWPNA